MTEAAAPAPYRKGWRAPWKGQWGTFGDGNSRLSRRAVEHVTKLEADYAVTSAHQRDRLQRAAQLLALADKVIATLGEDPKATMRNAVALERRAHAILAELGKPAPRSLRSVLEARVSRPGTASAGGGAP